MSDSNTPNPPGTEERLVQQLDSYFSNTATGNETGEASAPAAPNNAAGTSDQDRPPNLAPILMLSYLNHCMSKKSFTPEDIQKSVWEQKSKKLSQEDWEFCKYFISSKELLLQLAPGKKRKTQAQALIELILKKFPGVGVEMLTRLLDPSESAYIIYDVIEQVKCEPKCDAESIKQEEFMYSQKINKKIRENNKCFKFSMVFERLRNGSSLPEEKPFAPLEFRTITSEYSNIYTQMVKATTYVELMDVMSKLKTTRLSVNELYFSAKHMQNPEKDTQDEFWEAESEKVLELQPLMIDPQLESTSRQRLKILQELALQQKMLKEVDEIISMSFELVTKSLSTGNPHNPADVQSLMINSNAPSIPDQRKNDWMEYYNLNPLGQYPISSHFPRSDRIGPKLPAVIQKISIRYCLSKEIEVIETIDEWKCREFCTYDHNLKDFRRHKCEICEVEVQECDLSLRQTKWCSHIEDQVLLMYNRVNGRLEQYVFSFETKGFKEVYCSCIEVTYRGKNGPEEPVLLTNGSEHVVIKEADPGVVKLQLVGENHVEIPAVPVQQLSAEEIEMQDAYDSSSESGSESEVESESDSESESESEHESEQISYNKTFISTLPMFKVRHCPLSRKDVLYVRSNNLGQYEKYDYHPTYHRFEPFKCSKCKDATSEDHLVPKYAEHCPETNEFVIHTENLFTERMEQYIYDSMTQGFRQVYYPQFLYDPSKDHTSNVFVTVNYLSTVITRDKDGRFKKEKFCDNLKKFVAIPEVEVNTFTVQELEKKKNKRRVDSDSDSFEHIEIPDMVSASP